MTDHAPLTDEELAQIGGLYAEEASAALRQRDEWWARAVRSQQKRAELAEDENKRLCAEVALLRAALRRVMNVGDRVAVAVAHEALRDEVCGPCSLDVHDDCHRHDGDECGCTGTPTCGVALRVFVGTGLATRPSQSRPPTARP